MAFFDFDRFYRYDELTHDCTRSQRRGRISSPRVHRQEPRGTRHLGRNCHQHQDRACRRQAGAVDRRQYSFDRSVGLDREPLSARSPRLAVTVATPTSRAPSTHAPSTSARVSVPTVPNGRWPTARNSCAPRRASIRSRKTVSRAMSPRI